MATQTIVQVPEFNPQDLISIVHDELRTTSLKVAESFGKQHKDVLRKLERLDCSKEFASANFCADVQNVEIGNGAKRESKIYQMTKDGFMFLVMGFTGKKAAAIKEAYINAFNWMADRLSSDPVKDLPFITYFDEPVITFEMIDQVHGRKTGNANRRFYDDASRFQLGRDYYKITYKERGAFEGLGIKVSRGTGRVVLTASGYEKLTLKFAEPSAEQTRRRMLVEYFKGVGRGRNAAEQALLKNSYRLCTQWLTIQQYSPSPEQKVTDIFTWRQDMAEFGVRIKQGGIPDLLPVADLDKLREASGLLLQRVQMERDTRIPDVEYVEKSLRQQLDELEWAQRWKLV